MVRQSLERRRMPCNGRERARLARQCGEGFRLSGECLRVRCFECGVGPKRERRIREGGERLRIARQIREDLKRPEVPLMIAHPV